MLNLRYIETMLEQTLSQLGFGTKERMIYLALLQHGKMTPADISKLTRISRPTVYSVTQELVKKGLLHEDLGGKSRLFFARAPEDLIILTNREQKALEEKKQLVQRAITELKSVAQSDKYDVPKIVFIPEEGFRDYFFKRTADWHKSIMERDGSWWGFQDHTFAEKYKDYIDWHWAKAAPSTLTLHLLSNDSQIEKTIQRSSNQRRHVRYLKPGGNEFTASTWICGDYVIMAVTNVHPHYLVEIHDQTLAHNLRLVFQTLWANLESRNQK